MNKKKFGESHPVSAGIADDERDLFLYKASHDLKGPLASIMGLTNVAKDEVTDTTALKYFSLIEKSTKRLDSTISELLQFTRINKGNKEVDAINTTDLIQEVLESLKHAQNYEGIIFKIRIEQKKIFYNDKNMLTSILQNLIDNSIKYKRDNVQAFVNIDVADYKDGIKIAIEDNGIGIDKDYQDKIFSMFFRASTKSCGSGLGLYIVKNAINKLKGKISLKSTVNEGTTFTIYIPNEPTENNK